ncbi:MULTISPECIES: class I SAM-dependent methyltransferase [unclassified Tenacibaculum]|uniref:class I SAM-dependent methyltransferase n=1 Tax=unclassified Tenacibaculum TaxID=2635139 RepID=UPI001F32723E|nr:MULTISPECIES: class I SAM-dependent methyltransferase [unclassified Tenacibaculum]MCF2876533.1 class I SAM-dependent methyltransferase [Tenacibaculum sp. Cn5-1]MCF2936560.1 class I SAM-dependent methyltransferase [Tenacibaculum sp. Cn5-34]MCG7511847.1 class I SAM-dependent methyltransferase [Tenacibaculum sp. Cn5-46]
MKDFWNERYNHNEWAYGKEPNAYIKEKLPLFNAGKVLFPAEGEGRNAVYAATLGWNVSAFDYSLKGKEKADKLAQLNNVSIDYKVQAFLEEKYKQDEFDMICLTSVHFEPKIKAEMHKRLDSYLKKGGYIILEAFSKEHREINKKNPKVGGPSSEEEMYSLEEIKRDFSNYEIIELKNKNTYLQEGLYHIGNSAVIRFIGKKK